VLSVEGGLAPFRSSACLARPVPCAVHPTPRADQLSATPHPAHLLAVQSPLGPLHYHMPPSPCEPPLLRAGDLETFNAYRANLVRLMSTIGMQGVLRGAYKAEMAAKCGKPLEEFESKVRAEGYSSAGVYEVHIAYRRYDVHTVHVLLRRCSAGALATGGSGRQWRAVLRAYGVLAVRTCRCATNWSRGMYEHNARDFKPQAAPKPPYRTAPLPCVPPLPPRRSKSPHTGPTCTPCSPAAPPLPATLRAGRATSLSWARR
jgi:hypothetical protein